MNAPKKCSLLTVSISLFIGLTIVFSGFQTFGEEWTEDQKEILSKRCSDFNVSFVNSSIGRDT